MHGSVLMVIFCVMFTGGFIGWHAKGWQVRRATRKARTMS